MDAGSLVLVSAAPTSGFVISEQRTAPDEIEVRFEGPSTRTRIRVRLDHGLASGEVQEEGSGSSGVGPVRHLSGRRRRRQPARFGPARSTRIRIEHALVAHHGRPVVVPVGVLAAHGPVVVDERLERLRQVDDLGVPLDLHPRTEEVVGEPAVGGTRVAQEVLDLERRLPAADDHPALGVDGGRDR